MKQQELFRAAETDKQTGDNLLSVIEQGVHRIGLKEFAFIIQKEPSQLRDAFNQNGKYFSVTWLATFFRSDPQGATEFINYCCQLAGKEIPEDAREMSPEEELDFYKRKIREHGLEPIFRNGDRKI
jgi:hypothetical protein